MEQQQQVSNRIIENHEMNVQFKYCADAAPHSYGWGESDYY